MLLGLVFGIFVMCLQSIEPGTECCDQLLLLGIDSIACTQMRSQISGAFDGSHKGACLVQLRNHRLPAAENRFAVRGQYFRSNFCIVLTESFRLVLVQLKDCVPGSVGCT